AAAGDVAKRLFENFQDLEKLKGAAPETMADAMQELQERLGKSRERLAKDLDKGKRAIEAAKVFEKGNEFQQLDQRQRDRGRDINRLVEQIRRGEMQAGKTLSDLGARQRAIAEELGAWTSALGPILDALPDEFEQMREQGREFLEAVEHENIPEVMDG